MMVETILESPTDLGMSAGCLPQWKRELLQRRAARSQAAPRPPPAAPAPPAPAAPPADDDEELRYGPGIVKRLKSRYLSLALREAPRRRPSVLRRATSLEHLLEARPPPAPRPPRLSRPLSAVSAVAVSVAEPSLARRDLVKRARSVDALSRLVSLEEAAPPAPVSPSSPAPSPSPSPSPSPGPPPAFALVVPPPTPRPPLATSPSVPPAPPPPPPPPAQRAPRPPRRPAPLLREAERPPPDVVRAALRKFESAPPRRAAPAARVSAVLRGLGARHSAPPTPTPTAAASPPPPAFPAPRCSTPEPRARDPSPMAADVSAIDEPECAAREDTRPVSRATLESIARAGSTQRFAFSGACGSHLPPLAAINPVLLQRSRQAPAPRRVGVIRPMPAPPLERVAPRAPPARAPDADADDKPEAGAEPERREPPPSAAVEPRVRSPAPDAEPNVAYEKRQLADILERFERRSPTPEPKEAPPERAVNGHAEPPRAPDGKGSRISAARIERNCNGSAAGGGRAALGVRLRSGGGGGEATSVVFNFSSRKEVPDYVENDGLILRASRRDKLKAGDPGVVVLRPEQAADSDSEAEAEAEARPPSPCGVRFVNDNVLINGRSSMPARPNKDRIAKLKLQFDDSLTRTFEYPSETSLVEEAPARAALADNTHIGAASLNDYTPSKTAAAAFRLGLAPTDHYRRPHALRNGDAREAAAEAGAGAGAEGAARPCADDAARSFARARELSTDLLF